MGEQFHTHIYKIPEVNT